MRVWLLLIAVVVAAIAAYMALTSQQVGGEAGTECSLIPVSAKIYVDERGCGVGVVEVLMAGDCTGKAVIEGIEVYGFGTAQPLEPAVSLTPGGKLYIVVYGSKEGHPLALIFENKADVDEAVKRYIAEGLCIRDLTPSGGLPGTLQWSGRTVMFTWELVKAPEEEA